MEVFFIFYGGGGQATTLVYPPDGAHDIIFKMHSILYIFLLRIFPIALSYNYSYFALVVDISLSLSGGTTGGPLGGTPQDSLPPAHVCSTDNICVYGHASVIITVIFSNTVHTNITLHF